MSIKKLFDSTDKNRNYLSDTDEKNAFESVESERNLRALKRKQDTFVPPVNYEKPAQFAKYGSAYLYYKSAIERIYDYYPYDGSDAEINEFYNACQSIEKYIFNNKYPRTNGHISMSVDGWGSLSSIDSGSGYGNPAQKEYITFFGGPNTASYTNLKDAFPNSYNNKYQYSNIYDTDIYTTAGLPAEYGSGSRESNLKSDFNKGVTVEFWLKKDTFSNNLSSKEVVFDMWNNNDPRSADYGRITIELTGAANSVSSSPFLVTAQSGTTGIFTASIGQNLTTNSLTSWQHYAVCFYNSASNFVSKLYVNGALNDTYTQNSLTLGSLPSKDMAGRIGALLTTVAPVSGTALPGGAASAVLFSAATGSGKLAASLDEFRFWKARRNSNEIARYWKSQVRGGTNTDISNTTLGIYYKFNEGITSASATDMTILDYSGRVSNGAWTRNAGYDVTLRVTSSAMVEAGVVTSEYLDPIIYSTHPDVSSLKTELLEKGEKHDIANNSAFVNMMPSWVLEQDEETGTTTTSLNSDLRKMSHIVASYFDKISMQIGALPALKSTTWTTASSSPYPFAQHMPQSLGLYTPEIFVDSDVMEKFLNRNQNTFFESDLADAKNLIYLNLYNNLAGIYKAKGTEKAVKNVFRCFNIDDRLIRLKTYSNNEAYEIKNNLEQLLYEKSSVNFNLEDNTSGVVYQKAFASNSDSAGFISGSHSSSLSSYVVPGVGQQRTFYEGNYGCTVEANVIFPSFNKNSDTSLVNRKFLSSSLFGMYAVNATSSNSATYRDGTNPAFTSGSQDFANFQIFAIRDENESKNVRFMLTSSRDPFAGQFTELTSSTYMGVYNNEEWHFSFRLKPSNYPLASIVTGSGDTGVFNYTLEFRGTNAVLDTIQNSFLLTASVTQEAGLKFLTSAKRLYAGARRTNVTGTLLNKSDVLFGSIKYWAKYLENGILDQHLYDNRNVGLSASYQNISALDPTLSGSDALNSNTLGLFWEFESVTGSNTAGNFYPVKDISWGAPARRQDHWLGGITGYQHTGYGYGFATSSTNVTSNELYNTMKFTDPESVVASTMVKVLLDDDVVYGVRSSPPSYFHVIEKSMYNAISEAMLNFFGGAVDFNNIIGDPVNRYRERYKSMEKLRAIFFRRVTTVSNVEKFIDYYKWFDDAIALIISQLLPASAEYVENVSDVIESHVLERNKYKSAFPTIEFADPDIEGVILGGDDYVTRYEEMWGGSEESPRDTSLHEKFWLERASRNSRELKTSPDNTIADALRNDYRDLKQWHNDNSFKTFKKADGTTYTRVEFKTRFLTRPYVLREPVLEGRRRVKKKDDIITPSYRLKGGVNFGDPNPSLSFFYNATRPAGEVNIGGGTVPKNVILMFNGEMSNPDTQIQGNNENFPNGANRKDKKYFKTYYGPDYQSGFGKYNLKSSIALPFNIVRSPVTTGYNKQIADGFRDGVALVNLHHDGYGKHLEIPMQGPFTEKWVGGHQSRHIALNDGTDTYLTRPEAWKLLPGTLDGTTVKNKAGAIGIVGADYPWPEANEIDANPYPMTGSPKAPFYREITAKRPVNIRNIRITTDNPLGNFRHNYEVVNTFGAWSNPQQFISAQPTVPTEITQTPSASQTRTILDIYRDDAFHYIFVPEYSVAYLFSSTGKSVMINRFGAPGGIETSRGYRDIRSDEFSVYNTCRYRNWTVLRPFQQMSGSTSETSGSSSSGIRVSDIHGNDFGLRAHLTRHAGQFGRDSHLVSNPGASYDQSPAWNKINRNPISRLIITNPSYITSAQYDNFWVQHPIPRSDRQYSWITKSMVPSYDLRFYGYAKMTGPDTGYYSSSATGYTSFFDFISASSALGRKGTGSIYQTATRQNIYIVEPIDVANNIRGLPLADSVTGYYNDTLLDVYNLKDDLSLDSDYLNLLLTQRRSSFNDRRVPAMGHVKSRILTELRKDYKMSVKIGPTNPTNYMFKPVTMRGRIAHVNMDINDVNNTYCFTWNNELLYCSDQTLNDILELSEKKPTVFAQAVTLANIKDAYKLNWIYYTEMMFPSRKNEFTSGSRERPNFDNRFWRDTCEKRQTLQNETIITNSFGIRASGSSWPMDAGCDYLTKTKILTIDAADINYLTDNNTAGEYQSSYFHIMSGAHATAGNKARNLAASGLFARKHLLPNAQSAKVPTAGPNHKTGSGTTLVTYNNKLKYQMGAGEALCEPWSRAGSVKISGSGPSKAFVFVSKSSAGPWAYNDYATYIEEITTKFKDFAVIPEFRISEHVEDYIKNGPLGKTKLDTLEIVDAYDSAGNPINSSRPLFWKTFSNSEVNHHFKKVKDLSFLEPVEIMLEIDAAVKFNPSRKFYPQTYTGDLITQFSKSYGDTLQATTAAGSVQDRDGVLRPIMQPFFAPGILFNAIKAGAAVGWPRCEEPTKIVREFYGANVSGNADLWMINGGVTTTSPKPGLGTTDLEGYTSGSFWDAWIDFEAIMNPPKFISDTDFYDMEPFISAALPQFTCSMPPSSDRVYPLKASNFFAGIAEFYNKNKNFTMLESRPVAKNLRFKSGSIYASRVTLRRSWGGIRHWNNEIGSTGDTSPFGRDGARVYDKTNNKFLDSTYPIPQDPRKISLAGPGHSPLFYETFTMCDRPTAWGPAISGRPPKTVAFNTCSAARPYDSNEGFNWTHAPPWYHGEAWVDIVFSPGKYSDADTTYDLERILSECDIRCRRVDPGPDLAVIPTLSSSTRLKGTPLIPTFSGNIANRTPCIYGGAFVDLNAMQATASINLLGINPYYAEEIDKFGQRILTKPGETVADSWIISSKFETPMLNFSNNSALNAQDPSLPIYGSASTSRMIWCGYGIIDPDPNVGVFMEINDIPKRWLKNHYEVNSQPSIYNKGNALKFGEKAHKIIKPLTDIIEFSSTNSRARLGEVAEKTIVREAIVAIPYKLVSIKQTQTTDVAGKNTTSNEQEIKRFFGISKEKFEACLAENIGSAEGDSEEVAGWSPRNQISQMQKYIVPPQLDFISNRSLKPIVMCIIEFEKEFDQNDLAHMYQGCAPPDSENMQLMRKSLSFKLDKSELLTGDDILDPELRWMLFKIKQKSLAKYEDLIPAQVSQATKNLPSDSNSRGETNIASRGQSDIQVTRAEPTPIDNYEIGFNWPYDYMSFVESIKFDVKVLYKEAADRKRTQAMPDAAVNKLVGGEDIQMDQLETATAEKRPSPQLFNALRTPDQTQKDALKTLPINPDRKLPKEKEQTKSSITLEEVVAEAVVKVIKNEKE